MTTLDLSLTEQRALNAYEVVIERGLETFMEVGQALMMIRDERLYRLEFGTFEDYCDQRWGISRSRAHRLIEAASVAGNLLPIGNIHPVNESQARPLTSLTPDDQRAAWTEAVATAPNGKVTAAHVAQIAEHYKPAHVGSFDPDVDGDAEQPATSNGRHKPKTNRTSEEDSPPFDRCQTPHYAFSPLNVYLPRAAHIWESAAGEGLLAQSIGWQGFRVIATDILDGHDFLKDAPPAVWDIQITNPPYSKKYDWLARSYALGKPFALLLPVETLGAKTAQAMFREHGIEVVILDARVNFKMPELGWDGNGAQFPTAWFTWGLNIGHQLTFAHIEVRKDDR